MKLESKEFTNFEALYMIRDQNKRNVKSKNMWVVDSVLSEKINIYAKEIKFVSWIRDSGFYLLFWMYFAFTTICLRLSSTKNLNIKPPIRCWSTKIHSTFSLYLIGST